MMVLSNTIKKIAPILSSRSAGRCLCTLRRRNADGRKLGRASSDEHVANGNLSSGRNALIRSHLLHSERHGQLPTTSSRLQLSTSPTTSSLTEGEKETIDRLASDILSRNNGDDDDGKSNGISPQDMRRRIALSKAITLVESKSHRKRLMADALLDKLRRSVPETNNAPSFRLGVAGPPGVGKSTFVEALGLRVLALNEERSRQRERSFEPEKLAVLCIDPSSHVTGGSILGDKTRMSHLSHDPRAYVRPSPSSGTLGGLGSYTYDAASLCELAGYQMTIIETVGVGQSEVELAECCDLFLLLLAPGGGDSLQGSKKGIVEVADVLVVNKADGKTQTLARQTASEYKKAMELLRKPNGWWGGRKQIAQGEKDTTCQVPPAPPVLLVSAKTGFGLPELWSTIVDYQQYAQSSGYHSEKRRLQNRYWMWKYLRERVLEAAKKNPSVKRRAEEIENSLDSGLVAPRVAAGELWKHIVGSVDSENEDHND